MFFSALALRFSCYSPSRFILQQRRSVVKMFEFAAEMVTNGKDWQIMLSFIILYYAKKAAQNVKKIQNTSTQ